MEYARIARAAVIPDGLVLIAELPTSAPATRTNVLPTVTVADSSAFATPDGMVSIVLDLLARSTAPATVPASTDPVFATAAGEARHAPSTIVPTSCAPRTTVLENVLDTESARAESASATLVGREPSATCPSAQDGPTNVLSADSVTTAHATVSLAGQAQTATNPRACPPSRISNVLETECAFLESASASPATVETIVRCDRVEVTHPVTPRTGTAIWSKAFASAPTVGKAHRAHRKCVPPLTESNVLDAENAWMVASAAVSLDGKVVHVM